MVPGTPTCWFISYRFRGSSSLITPHLLPISNYASASLFWKSTGSYRFSNNFPVFCTVRLKIRDILCSVRGTTVLVGSARVIGKGNRPANVDFAVLGVSRDGKCHNAWCSAA